MLVLSRRVGESILIGTDIKVSILGVSGNQIRLGIEAPRAVSIYRSEVYERIHAETEVAQPKAKAN